jgi:hypothetical protein
VNLDCAVITHFFFTGENMLDQLVYLVLVIAYVAGADSVACSLDLIWPPSDAIILMCPDSKVVVVYLKLAGNCSDFVPPDKFYSLQFGLVAYNSGEMRTDKMLQQIAASPLTYDRTPVNFRMMRSPLLGSHKAPKGFSIWSLSLQYPWQNLDSLHHPDSVALTLELHLVTDISTPVASLNVPSTTLRMRLFGKPSPHFHQVRTRYTEIPGFVCKSTCGNMCNPRALSQENLLMLQPFESPVCTRVAHALNNMEWPLHGPSFTLQLRDPSSALRKISPTDHDSVTECSDSSVIAVLSVGSSTNSQEQHVEFMVEGPGRHRLLSVIANALTHSFDFLFLKNYHTTFSETRVKKIIKKSDLQCSYPFIAFHHQRIHADDLESSSHASADFGSINDGILLSRAAATLIIMAANDQSFDNITYGPPDPCSEFEVFSDAWLCWCASSLDIPALDIQFSAARQHSNSTSYDCAGFSAFFDNLDPLQTLSFQENQSHAPVDERYTSTEVDSAQRFRLLVQHVSHKLALELMNHPHSDFLAGKYNSEPHFWNACFSRLMINTMTRRVQSEAAMPLAQSVVLEDDSVTFDSRNNEAGHSATVSNNFVASLPMPMLDNEHLQLVTSSHQVVMSFDRSLQVAASFAWIVSGLWRGQRSLLTLHHLRDVVCAGLGRSHVHFYFIMSNVEEGGNAAMSSERRIEIQKLIQDTLPAGSVMLVVFQERVDHSGWLGRTVSGPRFCNFSCAESWCPPLQSAYNYIAATETYQFYRYAFWVLSRTDTHYGGPIAPAQRWHEVIPARGIAGSKWDYARGKIEWGKDDSFFVLRRCHAAAAFLHFPAFTLRLIKRESMTSSVKDRAVWSYTYCWAEAAVAYFFTTSPWSVGSMQVMDLCELGLVGSLQTHMNSGIRFNCPEPKLQQTAQS